MRLKWRIVIWLIIIVLGVPITMAAISGEWQIALGLAGILGTLASKLVESEEHST
jgi:uncharacterized membrane protein